jgi:hypothetical protein
MKGNIRVLCFIEYPLLKVGTQQVLPIPENTERIFARLHTQCSKKLQSLYSKYNTEIDLCLT